MFKTALFSFAKYFIIFYPGGKLKQQLRNNKFYSSRNKLSPVVVC